MTKQDYVLAVLADMPDANATEIADAIADRFGIDVSPAYVRVCKSRADRETIPETIPRTSSRSRSSALVPAVRSPAPVLSPTPRQLAQRDSDVITEEDQVMFALIDRTVEAVEQALRGHAQQIIATPERIAEIVALLDDPGLQADFPDVTYTLFWMGDGKKALVLHDRDTEAPDPNVRNPVAAQGVAIQVPADIPMPKQRTHDHKRDRKRDREPGCEFCTDKRPVAPGTNLYKVTSPVFSRQLILCTVHCMAEAKVPGTVIKPYRVYGGQFSAGVLEPRKSPFQIMIDSAKAMIIGAEQLTD